MDSVNFTGSTWVECVACLLGAHLFLCMLRPQQMVQLCYALTSACTQILGRGMNMRTIKHGPII